MVIRSITDIGNHRKTNDDSCYYDEEKAWMLIADGMGGYAGGRIASAITVNVFKDHFHGVSAESYREDLSEMFQLCNSEILAAAQKDTLYREMGTTLTVLAAQDNRYYIAHIGDSRAYLYRRGKLKRLTEDHNVVAMLEKSGQITEKEAKTHPGKSMLTRVMGRKPMGEIDFYEGELKKNDLLLLCTDGISGYLEDREIAAFLKNNDEIEKKLENLVKKVLDQSGEDNITAILAKNC